MGKDMSEYSYPCVVIGAGVIGISVARALALRGLDVMVLEAAASAAATPPPAPAATP